MHCPLCTRETCVRVDEFEKYDIYHCLFCGIDFSEPMEGGSVEFYTKQDTEHVKHYMNSPESFGFGHKNFFYDKPFQNGRLLDLGCGAGFFLNQAIHNGYDAVGIDFNKELVEFGKEYFKLENIYNISIEKFLAKKPLYKFDVITFFDVLDHLESPKNFMMDVRKFLIPDGCIALTVPNRKRRFLPEFIERYDVQPNHITWWDKDTLEFFLNTNGFLITRMTDELDEETLVSILYEKIKLGLINGELKKLELLKDENDILFRDIHNLNYQNNIILHYLSKIVLPFVKSKGLWIYALARAV